MSTPKVMTTKSWLFKSGTKAANSAAAFLQAHRAFLESGELAPITGEILAKVDAGELMPTPGLEMIRNAVLAHHIQVCAKQAEKQMVAASENETGGKSTKPWYVCLYTAKGDVCQKLNEKGKLIDLDMSFDLQQRASEWADRRLTSDCAADCFAVITHQPTSLEVVVLYVDAMGRVFPKQKNAATKKTGSRDNKLSWSAKVKQDHAHFSHG